MFSVKQIGEKWGDKNIRVDDLHSLRYVGIAIDGSGNFIPRQLVSLT
jgi:hypothetical protein